MPQASPQPRAEFTRHVSLHLGVAINVLLKIADVVQVLRRGAEQMRRAA